MDPNLLRQIGICLLDEPPHRLAAGQAPPYHDGIVPVLGGMRLLVVEALCAALISRVPMTVEVESEDGKALAAFSTDDLSMPEIDELDRRIMESLARGVRTLGLLSEELGIYKPTVWRRLRRLERAGMVKLSQGKRREVVVSLTERGQIYSELLSG